MATIHDLARMCNNSHACFGCPISEITNGTGCLGVLTDNPDEATKMIDEWVSEHPIRTYVSNFFEKFPNAPKDGDGYPADLCAIQVYGGECPYGDSYESSICKECWDREYIE